MPEFARVPRLRPPSLAARRVEAGYVLLDVCLTAILVGLALAMSWTPIPGRVQPSADRAPAVQRVQTL